MRRKHWLFGIFLVMFAARSQGEVVQHKGHMVDHKAATAICIACHNGKAARAVSVCDNKMCRIYANHVVGVEYPVNGSRKLAKQAEIALSGLALDEGKVGCSTCHDLRNTVSRSQLVHLRDDEDLCTLCHKM